MRDFEAAIPVPMPVSADWIAAQCEHASVDAQDDELALVFPIEVPDDTFDSFEHMGVRYPFTFGADKPLYHAIEIHLSRDFIHHASDQIEPIDTHCGCGEDLDYEPDHNQHQRWLAIRYEPRIRAICTCCGSPFNPQGRYADRTSGYTGESMSGLDAGAAYRFAVIIDCGKGWPRDQGPLAIAPEFSDLVATILGQPLVDFGEFY